MHKNQTVTQKPALNRKRIRQCHLRQKAQLIGPIEIVIGTVL